MLGDSAPVVIYMLENGGNMRKALAVILTFGLLIGLLPMISSVYAEEDSKYAVPGFTAGENLKYYKILKGDDHGNLNENDKIDRQQFAIIITRITGKAIEADSYAGQLSYNDANQIAAWAYKQVAYCESTGMLKGTGGGNFTPNSMITGEELATILMRILGYNDEDEWGKNSDKILEKTGVAIPSGELTRGQIFNVIWPIMTTPCTKDGKVLLEVVAPIYFDAAGEPLPWDSFDVIGIE